MGAPTAAKAGRPIEINGPYPDLSKMYVGYSWSKYATKEDIPDDYRFEDMKVTELAGGLEKTYILGAGKADGDFTEEITKETRTPTELTGQSGNVALDFSLRNTTNFYIVATDDITLQNPNANSGNEANILVEADNVAGITVDFSGGYHQHTPISLLNGQQVLIRCVFFEGRVFGDHVGPT
jgi:hypothetical protein